MLGSAGQRCSVGLHTWSPCHLGAGEGARGSFRVAGGPQPALALQTAPPDAGLSSHRRPGGKRGTLSVRWGCFQGGHAASGPELPGAGDLPSLQPRDPAQSQVLVNGGGFVQSEWRAEPRGDPGSCTGAPRMRFLLLPFGGHCPGPRDPGCPGRWSSGGRSSYCWVPIILKEGLATEDLRSPGPQTHAQQPSSGPKQ